MAWFKKHCEKCGAEVDKNTAPKRFGKYFCGEEHLGEYKKQIEQEQEQKPKTGGCCG